MIRSLLSFAVVTAIALPGQDAPATEAAPAPAPLPQANSPEARKLVEQAVDKMIAYGRGGFATSENQDSAMMRQFGGGPFGGGDVEVEGGWHRNLVWGDWDGREYVIGNGRMLAKVDGGWRLRRDKLAGGTKAPFTLDPDFLFTALQRLPEAARAVVNVEEGKVGDKRVAILSMQLDGEHALEFADSGAVPDAGGGFGQVLMIGGLGGLMETPRPELTTYLAFHVDVDSGDLLRFDSRTYSVDEMAGQIQIAAGPGGAFGGDDDDDDDEAVEEEAEQERGQEGPPKWKRGFPVKKPAKDESVTTFKVRFRQLGLAEPPSLDAEHKALLRVR